MCSIEKKISFLYVKLSSGLENQIASAKIVLSNNIFSFEYFGYEKDADCEPKQYTSQKHDS